MAKEVAEAGGGATPTTLVLVPGLYVIGLDIKSFATKLPRLTGRFKAGTEELA